MEDNLSIRGFDGQMERLSIFLSNVVRSRQSVLPWNEQHTSFGRIPAIKQAIPRRSARGATDCPVGLWLNPNWRKGA